MITHPVMRPRYVPDEPFPRYAFVPGRFPHPTRDPAGHSFGLRPERPVSLNPEKWRECRSYLFGVDLFNHGYYWEAHEAWESLWHACGRAGSTADLLRGLIRLAASGVKVREGRRAGVKSHATAARDLFQRIAGELGSAEVRYIGFRLGELCHFAAQVCAGKQILQVRPEDQVVFDFALRLE